MPIKTQLLLLGSCFLFFAMGCRDKCPPSVNIGAVALSSEGKSYVNPLGISKWIYTNAAGEIQILTAPLGVDSNTILECAFPLCTPHPWFESPTCFNLSKEFREITYENDSFRLIVSVRLVNFGGSNITTDTIPIEIINIISANKIVDQSSSLYKVIDYRNRTIAEIDSLFYNSYITLDSIHFIDSTYYDVITNDIIWYNKSHGLVAFKYENEIFELKNAE